VKEILRDLKSKFEDSKRVTKLFESYKTVKTIEDVEKLMSDTLKLQGKLMKKRDVKK
jgi:hypothetical protein